MDWNYILDKSKVPRDNKRIRLLVFILKKVRSDKLLLELFSEVADITVKQIKNLFFLIRFEEYEFISQDECIGESWIVFDRCIRGFKEDGINEFTIFYNVSLLRHFVRLKNKAYKRNTQNEKIHYQSYDNESFVKFFDRGKSQEFLPFIDEDLYNIELSVDEIRLFVSKYLVCERKKVFMENNEDFNENKYQNTLTSMKTKIKKYAGI